MAETAYGLVPARGGSIGIPDKNLKELAGKPLVVRAVETLLAVPELPTVILTTDSDRIAALGRQAGAEVPFLRPAALATPRSPVMEALAHALEFLERQGRRVDRIVMVQPTSPFVTPETVSAVLAHAVEHDLPLVQTVSPVSEHPYWVRVPAGKQMFPFHPTFGSLRRQDLPELVVLNGAVNCYHADVVRSGVLPSFPGYVCIDRRQGFDIDDAFDLHVAQLLAEANEKAPSQKARHVSSV